MLKFDVMETYMYYSEEEDIYNDRYKGHFSKKLADWAISRMIKKSSDGKIESVKKRSIEDFDLFIKENNMKVPYESYYDAYYLWHMADADYRKALEDAKHIAAFIDETINDPDCVPTAVLACFKAKMNECGIPIYWEKFI